MPSGAWEEELVVELVGVLVAVTEVRVLGGWQKRPWCGLLRLELKSVLIDEGYK
jgi:hypothetical protein